MLLVGLTGNYGSGKSSVLGMFEQLGAFTVDMDALVGELLKQPDVLGKVRALLGGVVFDREGGLMKEEVSRRVFADEGLRLGLEDILHPLAFEALTNLCRGRTEAVAVAEAPVLFERGHEGRFQRTIAVISSEPKVLERLQRKGVSTEVALSRLRCQMLPEEKVKRADFSVDNSGTPEETMAQVKKIYKEIYKEQTST